MTSPRVPGRSPPFPGSGGWAWARGPWPAKLGSRSRLVKAGLWTALCTSWGACGVFLWISVQSACELASRRGCPLRLNCQDVVHLLWTLMN
jgi:hypothetical protein